MRLKTKRFAGLALAAVPDTREEGGLVVLPDPDLSTADGLKSAVSAITARTNVLIGREKQGRVVTPEEWETVEKGWQELAARTKAVEDLVKAGGGLGRGDETMLLDKASLRLDVPDDLPGSQKLYFNAAVLKFEELAGLSHMPEQSWRGAGLMPAIAFAMASPGAARLAEKVARFQYLNDVLLVKDVLLAPAANKGRPDLHARLSRMKTYREWTEYERLCGEIGRAFNEGSATAGLNWVPTVLSAQMMDLVQPELRVAALFPGVTMTSKTLDWPVLGGDLVAYLMSEATADGSDTPISASTATLNKVTFTATKIGVRSFASSEVIEDSIVSMVPFILSNAAKVLSRAVEDGLINGEKGYTMDGATFNPAGGLRRAVNGLRYYALMTSSIPSKVDMGGVVPTTSKLLDVQLGMGVYGANPKAFAWITGFRGMKRLSGMTEMITLEKFGPNATILTGQVGALFGSPVILSEFMYDQKNTGVYGDGASRTFGSILGVYRDAFGLATRRSISIAASSDRYIETDQTVFVGTHRYDFQPFYMPSASVAPVGILYDIL